MNKKLIAPLLNAFTASSPGRSMTLVDGGQDAYARFFLIKHATTDIFTHDVLTKLLVGLTYSLTSLPGEDTIKLAISTVELPKSYSFLDVAEFALGNQEKGIFVGIGAEGPIFWDMESNFTHATCFGTTRSGKSSFLHLVLTQTISHPGYVSHIIDPKGEFTGYRQTPGVGVVASEANESSTLLRLMLIEIGFRKKVFSRFSTPPKNLADYQKLSAGLPREDFPELKRTVLYIDEFSTVNRNGNGNNDIIGALFRLGRSYGIHLFIVSQHLGDLYHKDQANVRFEFFGAMHIDCLQFPGRNKLYIPGRLNGRFEESGTNFVCQSPDVSPGDALVALSHLNKRPPLDNSGISRIRFQTDWILSSGFGVDNELLAMAGIDNLIARPGMNSSSVAYLRANGNPRLEASFFCRFHSVQDWNPGGHSAASTLVNEEPQTIAQEMEQFDKDLELSFMDFVDAAYGGPEIKTGTVTELKKGKRTPKKSEQIAKKSEQIPKKDKRPTAVKKKAGK